ncbi:hypothetical protein ACFOON_04940 [Novosphingobium piscinae]|uniref:Uncharacterized protein n=1 Tax=Novosphingobium piscinae TaxID=1507448 RepID=A0A7X1FXS4_9SPHN|nr:hypothetical protein [Novosphingobium piscinae]MBC2668317.1 hypothetical protein [Novosphingobium piscinae]
MLMGLLLSTALVGLDLFGTIGRSAPRYGAYALLVLAVAWSVDRIRRQARPTRVADAHWARRRIFGIGLLFGANGVVLALVLIRTVQTP